VNPVPGVDDSQALCELRWLLLSPPLLDAAPGAYSAPVQQFTPAERAAIESWLAQQGCDPRGLTRFLNAADAAHGATARLGRRAERVLEYFLRHGPTHRLVAANIALRNPPPHGERSTLGEIDFLVEDTQCRRWQWELAVKFFLCAASGPVAGPADFIGPDRAESFASKLTKMFTQQLKHQPPTPWSAHVWQPAAFTRGWLFYRYGPIAPQVSGLNPQHLRGHWIERCRLFELGAGEWHHLSRAQWMAPLCIAPGAGMDLATLAPRLDAVLPRAQLVARCEAGREIERVFVVPDDWGQAACRDTRRARASSAPERSLTSS
jgi:uncharacterized protein